MNKTKIEWCDYTWNPVTGCRHGCPYCYARKIATRFKGSKSWPNGFEPTLHTNRLSKPRKLGTQHYCPQSLAKKHTIFVCSMADLFGDWVPKDWKEAVFKACKAAPQHTYIFLTKNPAGIPVEEYPQNWWFGVTIDGTESTRTIIKKLDCLKKITIPNRFISFEPLLGDIPGNVDLTIAKGIIIGAQTAPAVYPNLEWLDNLILRACCLDVSIFIKNNLIPTILLHRRYFYDMRDLPWPVRKGMSG